MLWLRTSAFRNQKNANAETTDFTVPVIGDALGYSAGNTTQTLMDETARLFTEPIRLSIQKRGWRYRVSLDIGQSDADRKPIVHKTDILTSLHMPGELAFSIGKWDDAHGEVLLTIDSVEIVSVSE